MSVGAKIREVRKRQLGLTQREFAERLQSRNGNTPDPVNVSRWERGQAEPSLNYLRQIAEIAELPVSWFFAEEAA